MERLVEVNSSLDISALAAEFARTGRLQIRDVLTNDSALAIQKILVEHTAWGLAWQAGASAPPQLIRADELATLSAGELTRRATRAAADEEYGFAYLSYPLVTAYLERWEPGSPHERLLEELNGSTMLEFMRAVTGFSEIIKMDGQATLYAPGHFLRPHNDEESERGRLVAYVLGVTLGEWKPHWGGYLNFFDADWNIAQAFRPQFNCLNLFRVPQWHSVSEVVSGAPLARYSVTGWARNR